MILCRLLDLGSALGLGENIPREIPPQHFPSFPYLGFLTSKTLFDNLSVMLLNVLSTISIKDLQSVRRHQW